MSDLSPIPLDKIKKQYLSYLDQNNSSNNASDENNITVIKDPNNVPKSPQGLKSPSSASSSSLSIKYSPKSKASNTGDILKNINANEVNLTSQKHPSRTKYFETDLKNMELHDQNTHSSGSSVFTSRTGSSESGSGSEASGYKHTLYQLSEVDPKSSLNVEKEKKILQMAGYSQKLSSSVLDELTKKAEKFSDNYVSNNQNGQHDNNEELLRKGSIQQRFNAIHQKDFRRMESITNHYSAIRRRKQLQESKERQMAASAAAKSLLQRTEREKRSPESMPRREIEVEEEEEPQENCATPKRSSIYSSNSDSTDVTITTPVKDSSKRLSNVQLSSASKRRRTLIGPREVPEGLRSPNRANKAAVQSVEGEFLKANADMEAMSTNDSVPLNSHPQTFDNVISLEKRGARNDSDIESKVESMLGGFARVRKTSSNLARNQGNKQEKSRNNNPDDFIDFKSSNIEENIRKYTNGGQPIEPLRIVHKVETVKQGLEPPNDVLSDNAPHTDADVSMKMDMSMVQDGAQMDISMVQDATNNDNGHEVYGEKNALSKKRSDNNVKDSSVTDITMDKASDTVIVRNRETKEPPKPVLQLRTILPPSFTSRRAPVARNSLANSRPSTNLSSYITPGKTTTSTLHVNASNAAASASSAPRTTKKPQLAYGGYKLPYFAASKSLAKARSLSNESNIRSVSGSSTSRSASGASVDSKASTVSSSSSSSASSASASSSNFHFARPLNRANTKSQANLRAERNRAQNTQNATVKLARSNGSLRSAASHETLNKSGSSHTKIPSQSSLSRKSSMPSFCQPTAASLSRQSSRNNLKNSPSSSSSTFGKTNSDATKSTIRSSTSKSSVKNSNLKLNDVVRTKSVNQIYGGSPTKPGSVTRSIYGRGEFNKSTSSFSSAR